VDPVGALKAAVEKLEDVTGVEGTVIASPTGLVIYSDLPLDPRSTAAMAGVIVKASRSAMAELGRGDYAMTIVQSTKGKLLCAPAGADAILAVLVTDRANLGYILLQVREVGLRVEAAMRAL
jgi:predicted regulator of Ras-like GTPase activity (Roadblock/LC7/MglB family)